MNVADYFSTTDPFYAFQLNKHIYNMIQGALHSEYAVSLERKVILAQENPEQQKIQHEKYQLRRKALLGELRGLRIKCGKFEKKGSR
jgi:hypothetical protein